MPAPTEEARAVVSGYRTPDDGGGGVFHWDPTATMDDDDGTILTPFGREGAGRPGRWRRAEPAGHVSIAWFGAVPHDRSAARANSKAIQRALKTAQTAPGPERASLRIPSGIFYVDQTLTLTSIPLSVRGEGMAESGLAAVAGSKLGSQDAILSFADIAQNTRFEFTDFFLFGEGVVGYGIRSSKADHALIRRVWVRGTMAAGIQLGYGWCNSIQNCEISYNRGDGLVLNATSNNAVSVSENKIFANGGAGLRVLGGTAVNILGNTFELNQICGVYLYAVLAGSITGNYFEQNSEAGLAFASPAEVVHADVILNGANNSQPTMGHAYPSIGLEIAQNYTVSRVPGAVFAWLGGAWPVDLRGNVSPDLPELARAPLLGCMAEGAYAYASRITMESNSGFSDDYAFRNAARGVIADLSTWSRDDAPSTNHATDDVFRYARLSNGGGGVLQRHGRRRSGCEVMELTGAVSSDIWGFSVDLAEAPELADRWIYFAAEAAASTPRANLRVAVRAGAGWIFSTDSEAGTTAWSVHQLALRTPASGRVEFGVSKIGGLASDSVFFARPVLTAVGAPFSLFYREPHPPNWTSPYPPEHGAWSPGDIVLDPAPRGTGAIGWVCVRGGTPGIWKPYAPVAR